jgi:hypothetical protein
MEALKQDSKNITNYKKVENSRSFLIPKNDLLFYIITVVTQRKFSF